MTSTAEAALFLVSGIARRSLLALLLLALLAGCGGGGKSKHAQPPYQHFQSRPDLKPPVVTITKSSRAAAPGFVFLAPKKKVAQQGPLIVDDAGQVVWFHPLPQGAADFRVQRYRGRPVLTWWQGVSTKGVGRGRYEIFDTSYRRIAEVRAGHGLAGDEHEFLLTPRGTAWITIYRKVPQDLSAVGASPRGYAYDSIVQEVDVATGHVRFEWHSLGNVALTESYLTKLPQKPAQPYDYFHVNSVEPEPDGNLLISARHTDAVYEISRRTGEILWRLGGKRSDFRMGAGTRFAWQHDARRRPDGTITIFDDGAAPAVEKRSRAIVLRLDTKRKTAKLVRAYTNDDILASSQGNAQFLPDGHVFVGWGSEPRFTEFDRAGKVLFDGRFNHGADSYRDYRFPWVGRPTDPPSITVDSHGKGTATIYASWNGATRVRRWEVLAGSDQGHLRRIADAPKRGFETAIRVHAKGPSFRVRALDAAGRALGVSLLARLSSET